MDTVDQYINGKVLVYSQFLTTFFNLEIYQETGELDYFGAFPMRNFLFTDVPIHSTYVIA